MKLQRLSTALLLLIAAATIHAQAPTGGSGGVVRGLIGPAGNQRLKGIPFSADITNVVTRTFADGNRINRETHGRTFRDSEGRTRRESEFDLPDGTKRMTITISDPVQHVMIMLDPQVKTATVHHFRLEGPMVGRVAPVIPNPPTVTLASRQPSAEIVSLGTKDIEGFAVIGTRVSRTIEAGRIGNEKPITTVHETWFSEELKLDLLTRRDDPQMGQSTMTLSNIHTGEPDPLLFQVPADYTVKDNKDNP